MLPDSPAIVVDTNVFVAAAFRSESDSARILRLVRRGELRMVWSAPTLRETRSVLERIPPLSWGAFEGLFLAENEFRGEVHPEQFRQIPDSQDRKFAALAHATGAILVSHDADLLSQPQRVDVLVLTPSEFLTELRPSSCSVPG